MIIINVLPPEYRRRDIGVNPITLSIAGAVAVNLIVLALWLFIMLISIPHAEEMKVSKTAARDKAKTAAAEVDKIKKEIATQKLKKQALFDLLNKKVLWAKTLDDFTQILTDKSNRLNNSKFQVSIASLEVSETIQKDSRVRRTAAKANTVKGRSFAFKWKVQIVNQDAELMPANVRTFFLEFEKDKEKQRTFWEDHSFKNRPDKNFGGYRVVTDDDINRSHTSFDLNWTRFVVSNNAEQSVAQRRSEGGNK